MIWWDRMLTSPLRAKILLQQLYQGFPVQMLLPMSFKHWQPHSRNKRCHHHPDMEISGTVWPKRLWTVSSIPLICCTSIYQLTSYRSRCSNFTIRHHTGFQSLPTQQLLHQINQHLRTLDTNSFNFSDVLSTISFLIAIEFPIGILE